MLDLVKESVHLYNMCTTKWQKTTIENDCIIPDNLPDVLSISAIDANAKTNSIFKTSEGTKVNFSIIYKILYVPVNESFSDDPQPREIKAFTYITDETVIFDNNLPDESKIYSNFGIDDTETIIVNSRKIALKTFCNIRLSANFNSDEDICTNITGSEDMQYKTETIPLVTLDSFITESIEINEGIELSSIKAPYKEILRSDTALRNISTSINSDGIILKGNLEISTLYIAEDATKSMQIIENELSFTHNISANNTEDTTWNTELFLDDIDITVIPDSDNENRILQITGNINVNAYSYKSCNVEILTDAYSLKKDLTLDKKILSAFSRADNMYSQFIFKDSIIIDEKLPGMSEIINVRADLCEYTCTTDNEKADIQGNIVADVFYISSDDNKPVSSAAIKLPFSHTIENIFPGKNTVNNLSLNVNHISYNILSENEIDLRISISIKGFFAEVCEFEIITGASENEIPPSDIEKPSILLYVVQSNDTLWTVAKRYNAPIEILKEINHIKEIDSIFPGQKLLIPC